MEDECPSSFFWGGVGASTSGEGHGTCPEDGECESQGTSATQEREDSQTKVQPAFVSGIYNTVYFKNTTSDSGPYTFVKHPQKQQSYMSEVCNEDQEKENTFDYGLDTSFKPDECSNAGKSLVRAQKSAGSFQAFANSLERMRQNYEANDCTRINLLVKEPIPFTYGTDFPALQVSIEHF
ncbi:hypothetical protein NDU88_004428 [Pleurodeles waltl]|uniref:Uncharacterized protein n=1 Tax=Pleurodeles waltl TaxID=8319 RepID=A0AAV7NTN8_PLEWA|nr:hypothetical protein NDU88_004428 [Pleurodeles waltl]